MLTYMLDTNIVIYIINRRPLGVLNIFNEHEDRMAISTVTYAELLYGAEKSAIPARNIRAVDQFVSHLKVLDYDRKAAAHFGHIQACLQRTGRTIGVNDMHIAAHARSQGMVMVTNNMKEFERIEGLLLDNWM